MGDCLCSSVIIGIFNNWAKSPNPDTRERWHMKIIHKNRLPNYLFFLTLLCVSFAARADIPAGYSVLETITYSYDDSGNRISKGATVSGTPETPIEAQYDTGNRLTQLTLKGQGLNGTDLVCALGYDPNGNLSTKACGTETTQYAWDARNRLTGIQSPTVTASFKYDALGRRIERTINGDTIQYLYDGDQAIAELRNGAVSAHLLTGLAIDETIARYTNEGERTLLTDALGSVLITAKEDATVVTAYGYSPYGENQIMGTDEHNPIQYTARENDDTGLYYYRARYYDPQLKRFISEDPIGIDGGPNVYAYVRGNPTNKIDPYGLIDGFPSAGDLSNQLGPLVGLPPYDPNLKPICCDNEKLTRCLLPLTVDARSCYTYIKSRLLDRQAGLECLNAGIAGYSCYQSNCGEDKCPSCKN